jgi:hypothetical protein
MDALFYKNTLLPSLFKAKQTGVNIRNKSALLKHFTQSEFEPEHFWVCCAAGADLSATADIVDRMASVKSNVLAELNLFSDFPEKGLKQAVAGLETEVATGLQQLLSASSEVDKLNSLLWKSNLKVLAPKIAAEKDVMDLAQRAFSYLKKEAKADDTLIQEAVVDFIDQVYLSDADFHHDIEPKKIFAATKHLYYKHTGDDLDDTEIDSEITDEQIQLGMREFKKHLV